MHGSYVSLQRTRVWDGTPVIVFSSFSFSFLFLGARAFKAPPYRVDTDIEKYPLLHKSNSAHACSRLESAVHASARDACDAPDVYLQGSACPR